MADTINFYRTDDEYGEFSNFAPYPITMNDGVWPTTEHYFQAQKFEGMEYREAIRVEPSPMIAARMGRDRSKPLRADWETSKVAIMTEAVRAKFTQHSGLRAKLLATRDATIVEHTKNDNFWGDGGDGNGANMLGKILMEVREQLRALDGRPAN